MQYHELSELYPMLPTPELSALADSIAEMGLLEPVTLYEGAILDGRNRYEACLLAEVEPAYRDYQGEDPIGYVIAANELRRHLNESQRAMAAAKLANMEVGRPANKAANLPDISQDVAANKLHVSERTVRSAVKVRATGVPELIDAAEQGHITVSLAASIADAPKDFQEDVVELIDAGYKPAEAVRQAKNDQETDPTATKTAHVSHNSGKYEWYTPPKIIDKARRVMGGVDTDPASSETANKVVKAKQFYTSETNGLEQQWHGSVWMNPPYSQPLVNKFCRAFLDKYKGKEFSCGIVLVNNATETKWLQPLLLGCDAVCFTRGRLKFIGIDGKPSGAPLQGQCILYFGDNVQGFVDEFLPIGVVMRGIRRPK